MCLLSLLLALKWKSAVYFYMARILRNKLHFNAVYFLVKLHCSEWLLTWDGDGIPQELNFGEITQNKILI